MGISNDPSNLPSKAGRTKPYILSEKFIAATTQEPAPRYTHHTDDASIGQSPRQVERGGERGRSSGHLQELSRRSQGTRTTCKLSSRSWQKNSLLGGIDDLLAGFFRNH
jgi:hypothetical protein